MRREYNFIKALGDLYESDSIRESNNDLIVMRSSYLEVLEGLSHREGLETEQKEVGLIQDFISNISKIIKKEDNKK
ncbi:hypothetical protein [Halonatronum saccharophilum]|uniref:hypothetical protein n=1 Tax=Halonatronum saccharophilum TaxID=150060 RepID=UPI0004867613|nr:hypothetical protein [Halonatronum saccharophilum]